MAFSKWAEAQQRLVDWAPEQSCRSCVWATWLLSGMYTVTWCFVFIPPLCLPSHHVAPPSLCSSTPAHPARRWVLHSHPLVSASHARDTGAKKKKKIQWRLLERAFEEVVFASQMPRPDASVRIMFLYILTCMHFSTKQKEQTHRPSAEESRGIKKQASDIKLTRFNTWK